MTELSLWLQLLYILAEKASELQCIELAWGANCEFFWHLEWGVKKRGLSDNLNFVHVLKKIQELKKLVIKGYYAKNWPAYLKKRMSVQVQAICNHSCEKHELKKRGLNNEELRVEKLICEMNEKKLQTFEKYQQGTEDLIS